MLKIFVTGDNHIGKKYDRYPEIKETLIESRFKCLENMVRQAEKESCDIFVITGDLFDNVSSVKQSDIKRTVEILSAFDGSVLVLPGNHDYYTGEEHVWKIFLNSLSSADGNITLLADMREYILDAGDEKVVIYPAPCRSKHSHENNLGWIKETEISKDGYRIGIAHGAIEGITPDMKNEYFLMTEGELEGIGADVWLIGHTHIPYPKLKEDEETVGYKIFNAGTHEQTDLSNNTEGYCFVITIDKSSDKTVVSARSVKSGRVRYYDVAVLIGTDENLKEKIEETLQDIGDFSVLRLTLSGSVTSDEYAQRHAIYKSCLDRFLTYETNDNALSELITPEKIRSEFAEISFAAELIEKLSGDSKEMQMAYELLKSCIEEEGQA